VLWMDDMHPAIDKDKPSYGSGSGVSA
jgi:hypothetical protein